jgi:hypothetical protein
VYTPSGIATIDEDIELSDGVLRTSGSFAFLLASSSSIFSLVRCKSSLASLAKNQLCFRYLLLYQVTSSQ